MEGQQKQPIRTNKPFLQKERIQRIKINQSSLETLFKDWKVKTPYFFFNVPSFSDIQFLLAVFVKFVFILQMSLIAKSL